MGENVPFIALAVIAVLALGVLTYASFGPTQGSVLSGDIPKLIKLPPKPIPLPPKQIIVQKSDDTVYQTADLSYSGKVQSEGMFAGLSIYDCQILHEIIKLEKDTGKGTGELNFYENVCNGLGW
jgi:hypothetical protein